MCDRKVIAPLGHQAMDEASSKKYRTGADPDHGAVWLRQFTLEHHPLADVFPDMSAEDYADLREDIRQHGLRQPVVLFQGKILDGRHRYRACKELDVDYQIERYIGNNPIEFVISLNLRRRHLSTSQRAMMAAKLATLKQGQKADAANAVSQDAAARMLKVSADSIQRGRKVIKDGVPALVESVIQGDISVTKAVAISDLPASDQLRHIKAVRKESTVVRPPRNEDLFADIEVDGKRLSKKAFAHIVNTAIVAINQLDKLMCEAFWDTAPHHRRGARDARKRYRSRVNELVEHVRTELKGFRPKRAET